jgi:hypothetical protein
VKFLIQAISKKQQYRSAIDLLKIVLLVVSVMQFGGCATSQVMNKAGTSQNSSPTPPVVLTDVIVAIGQPDEELSKTLKNSNMIALLGTQNTYMLYSGGEFFTQMAKNLNAYKITIVKDSGKLHIDGKRFFGHIKVTYGPEPFTEDEKNMLAKLGFAPLASRQMGYSKEIFVQGTVHAALPVGNSEQLKQPREIVFRASPAVEGNDINWQRVGEYSAAVAFDIVTSPFQLLGLAVYKIVEKKPTPTKY